MLYYINQAHTSSFPVGLVKTESDFIVRSVETGLVLMVILFGFLRNRYFLVALRLIVRGPNLEVATKRLLHQ